MKRAQQCPKGHSRVRIRYFAVPNENKNRGGYCPAYRVNNQRTLYNRNKFHTHGDTFCRGYDHDQALRAARAMAQEEAARYRGDQCVWIEGSVRGERQPKPRRR